MCLFGGSLLAPTRASSALRTLPQRPPLFRTVSNIRSHLLITLMSMSALIYTTVNPESILSVIGIGYSMRVGLAIHAIELALKVCVGACACFGCVVLLVRERWSELFSADALCVISRLYARSMASTERNPVSVRRQQRARTH